MSVSASAAAGFAVNDSGIVTAATSMIFAAFTILIMCIGKEKRYEYGLSYFGASGLRVSRLCFGSLTIGPLQAGLGLEEGASVIRVALTWE